MRQGDEHAPQTAEILRQDGEDRRIAMAGGKRSTMIGGLQATGRIDKEDFGQECRQFRRAEAGGEIQGEIKIGVPTPGG